MFVLRSIQGDSRLHRQNQLHKDERRQMYRLYSLMNCPSDSWKEWTWDDFIYWPLMTLTLHILSYRANDQCCLKTTMEKFKSSFLFFFSGSFGNRSVCPALCWTGPNRCSRESPSISCLVFKFYFKSVNLYYIVWSCGV